MEIQSYLLTQNLRYKQLVTITAVVGDQRVQDKVENQIL